MDTVLLVRVNIEGNHINEHWVLKPNVPNEYDAVTVDIETETVAVIANKGDTKCVKSGATTEFGGKLLSIDIYRYHDEYWTLAKYVTVERTF